MGFEIAGARAQLGLNQAELGKRLACTQQSVSRWEAGTSRPRAAQLGQVATALQIDPKRLAALAGYEPKSGAITSFAKLLPVDALEPDTFERFVLYLMKQLHPSAHVWRAGESGHTQDGSDVWVEEGGVKRSHQCKRVANFGPADVTRAVQAHTADADGKVLVLSRSASPQTRAEVQRSEGWELLDREDLTRLVRLELSADAQDRLVEIFFPGQLEALFGRSASSPWLTTEQFFAPFDERTNALLNHRWTFRGRIAEATQLDIALANVAEPVVLVVGAGGQGKSRLLKEAAKGWAQAHPEGVVRFLSPTAESSRASIQALGPSPKLLIVDDAHDRDGLAGLIELAASPANHVKLVLATRPYATQRIRSEASRFAIGSPPQVELKRMSQEEVTELVADVLRDNGGDPAHAESIAAATRDCPMVAVIGARIIARDRVPLELAKNDEALRHRIFGGFRTTITQTLAATADAKSVSAILDVLAMVQPFSPADKTLLELAASYAGVAPTTVQRVLTKLEEAGVVYRRGVQHRLMPDLLGDYVLEEGVVELGGRISESAEALFDELAPPLLNHALVNLGRLDWRRSAGDPASSRLLDGIWRRMDTVTDAYDPRLDAVRDVAIYQPRQALDFVERLAARGVAKKKLPPILRSIGYNLDYVREVCELLWELGRDDDRTLDQHSDHAVRMLTELCGYEYNKPLGYNEPVFEFALELSERPEEWRGAHTPLDIFRMVLSTEGTTNRSDGLTFTIGSFLISYEVVAGFRRRAIERILQLIASPDPRIALRAASAIGDATRYPVGLVGLQVPDTAYADYDPEFTDTLSRVADLVASGSLHATVMIQLARQATWMARNGRGRAKPAAQRILDDLPTDIGFRTRGALSDGYGQVFIDMSEDDWSGRLARWIGELVADLKAAFPRAQDLCAFLADAVSDVALIGGEDRSNGYPLIQSLLEKNLPLARLFVDAAADPCSPLRPYAAVALFELVSAAPEEGRARARAYLASDDERLQRSAPLSITGLRRPLEAEDKKLIAECLSSTETAVVQSAFRALWAEKDLSDREAIELGQIARITDADCAEGLALLYKGAGSERLAAFTAADAQAFLDQISEVPELKGHWTQEVLAWLSARFPHQVADFFFARVERAMGTGAFFQPAPYGPWSLQKLQITSSPESGAILQRTWNWLRANAHRDRNFQEHAANVFDAMFLIEPAADDLVSFFDGVVDQASVAELKLIARVLRAAHHNFVFTQRPFVLRLLARCQAIEPELSRRVAGELFGSAISGVRSGAPGEPMPRDLQTFEKASEALRLTSRLSPAYQLYRDLKEDAERDIARSRAEREALEDR